MDPEYFQTAFFRFPCKQYYLFLYYSISVNGHPWKSVNLLHHTFSRRWYAPHALLLRSTAEARVHSL